MWLYGYYNVETARNHPWKMKFFYAINDKRDKSSSCSGCLGPIYKTFNWKSVNSGGCAVNAQVEANLFKLGNISLLTKGHREWQNTFFCHSLCRVSDRLHDYTTTYQLHQLELKNSFSLICCPITLQAFLFQKEPQFHPSVILRSSHLLHPLLPAVRSQRSAAILFSFFFCGFDCGRRLEEAGENPHWHWDNMKTSHKKAAGVERHRCDTPLFSKWRQSNRFGGRCNIALSYDGKSAEAKKKPSQIKHHLFGTHLAFHQVHQIPIEWWWNGSQCIVFPELWWVNGSTDSRVTLHTLQCRKQTQYKLLYGCEPDKLEMYINGFELT